MDEKEIRCKYQYYVTYNHSKGNASGVGGIDIYLNNKINNLDTINDIRLFIKDKNNFDNVIVINYILVKKGGLLCFLLSNVTSAVKKCLSLLRR
jgi:hypothetical protein